MVEPIGATAQWIAENQRLAAPVVAFFVSYVLYGVLGKRLLGADDDFWEVIRRRLIPKLDGLVAHTPLYTIRTADRNELAAVVPMPPEKFEEELEEMGYHRNPLASLKVNDDEPPKMEVGSWAKRQGRVEYVADMLERVPYRGFFLGRFLTALDDVLAMKQTHVMLFRAENGETIVYAHHEYNSINPLTAYRHYKGDKGWDVGRGITEIRADLSKAGISFRVHR